MKKQLLIFVLMLLPMVASADDSGKCGENVNYTYVEATHTLTISGTGAMYDFKWDNSLQVYATPWVSYKKDILSVFILDGVTSIGERAFSGCSGITSITIPNSVTSIGGYAFDSCNGLTSVTIPISVTTIDRGTFIRCSGLTSVTIPNSVTYIGLSAFAGCSGLISVTIGNSVTRIDQRAFEGCSALTSVHISDIAAWCKMSCSNASSNPLEYAHHLFLGDEEIKDLVIPSNVTSIGDATFMGCSGLTSVSIPNSVTSIGYSTFSYCSGLTSVTIPNNLKSMKLGVFRNCSSLTSVTIPNSVTSIEDEAFWCCSGLTSLTIPDNVTSIGCYAFWCCSGLTSVTIGNSVTRIDQRAFEGCSSLTSVTIGNSVTSIGYGAFQGCSGLTSVTIPNSVTSIGQYAFSGCSKGLGLILVESGNPKYDSRNYCNAIIETETNTLILGCKNTIIPNNVTSIGKHAFYGCSGLTSVTIPNSVTSIGDEAFYGCSGLTSVTIPNSVTSIGWGAFNGCSDLTSVTIPNRMTSIDGYTFSGCSELTSVTIPNSVISIGDGAFAGCSGLRSVTISSAVRNIGSVAFAKCANLETVNCLAENVPSTYSTAFQDSDSQNATLFVPAGSLNAYKNTVPWSEFGTIKAIESTQKCAIPSIFYGNKKLLFNCETEGVEYVYEIKDADIKKGYDSEVQLSATYEISVYATKQGYENSDIATAILVWGSATFTETTGQATAAPAINVESPLLIQSQGGMLTVQGADDGTKIGVYNINGTLAGEGISRNGCATVNTNLQPGSVAIIKIGDKSVKIIM